MCTTCNRYDKKPFWAWYGHDEITGTQTCPKHKKIHHRLEIMNLKAKVIGHLVWNESLYGGSWSRYITIDKHSNRSAFWRKDVYCNECKDWHFAGLD
jgi:hypothetical protein